MTAQLATLYTLALLIGTNTFGFVYSYLILNHNLFSKFRIQTKKYKSGILGQRLPLYLMNLLTLLILSGVGIYFCFPFFDTESYSLYVIVCQVLFAFIIDDIWFYFMHRIFHENNFLLRKVHSIHHRSSTPFPLEYLYVHPVEWMSGMVGAAFAFFLILLVMPINIYAFWIFGILRNMHEIHIHSDLELPVISKIPFLSTTRHHDDHHAKLKGNYASTFAWMDSIFKTNFKQ
jgi:sterol desaturase/sphingolipid hydroxylase (fatty acid hydroxylase superfamily)